MTDLHFQPVLFFNSYTQNTDYERKLSTVLYYYVSFYFSFHFFGLLLLSSLILSEYFYDSIFPLIYHINYNSYFKHFLEVIPSIKYFYNQPKCSLLRQYRNHFQSLGSILTSLWLLCSQTYCCCYYEEHTVHFILPSCTPSLKLSFLWRCHVSTCVCGGVWVCARAQM